MGKRICINTNSMYKHRQFLSEITTNSLSQDYFIEEVPESESSLSQRRRELDELFNQEPWFIEYHIRQNYTQRAIYLNDLMREAQASWSNSPFL